MMTMMKRMMTMQSSGSGSAARQLVQVASLLAIALLLIAQFPDRVECQEQLSIESRQQKDSDDLTDTIKYLEKLDKYFSQIARPRFGRSEYKQPHRLQPGWLSSRDAIGSLDTTRSDTAARYSNGVDLLELARGRFY